MRPDGLKALIKHGKVESYKKGQVFHSLDFKAEFYLVNKGYVNRYSIDDEKHKVMESIYGPGYFFPLTPVYTRIFKLELSQERLTYYYEAMSDVELQGMTLDELEAAVEKDPMLFRDLFYESGIRLRANINRLASNAIKDEYKRVIHQLVYLAQEFGEEKNTEGTVAIKLKLPLKPLDMAEQLNISEEIADAAMSRMEKHGLIIIKGETVTIPDLHLIKDVEL